MDKDNALCAIHKMKNQIKKTVGEMNVACIFVIPPNKMNHGMHDILLTTSKQIQIAIHFKCVWH